MSVTIERERAEAATRDPEIVHLVPRAKAGNRIALCGFDCTGRTEKQWGMESCVVCIDLARLA